MVPCIWSAKQEQAQQVQGLHLLRHLFLTVLNVARFPVSGSVNQSYLEFVSNVGSFFAFFMVENPKALVLMPGTTGKRSRIKD